MTTAEANTKRGVRAAAVAGSFYPADVGELARVVDLMLGSATAATATSSHALNAKPAPKALVLPHAGYIYSGPIAASACARVAKLAGAIERVVLLGPAHRVALLGLATTSAAAWSTPLG